MAKTVSDTLGVRIVQKGGRKVFDLRKTFNENPNRVIDGWNRHRRRLGQHRPDVPFLSSGRKYDHRGDGKGIPDCSQHS